MTAALIPGAAVSSSAAAGSMDCLDVDPAQLATAVEASRVIVIGTVHEENGGGAVRIEPSAFLLGAASNEPIRPQSPNPLPDCALARLSEGQRILAFLPAADGVLQWPSAGRVFWLDGGHATSAGASPKTITEIELTDKIKAITGQYAFPAASRSRYSASACSPSGSISSEASIA